MKKLLILIFSFFLLSSPSVSIANSPSITLKLLSYQQDSEHCNLIYSITNNSWGSIKGLLIRTEAFDDRGIEIDGYGWGDTISPFESYFDPLITIPVGGIAKSDDLSYKGQCKYIETINVLEVKDKFCNIRMMPNEAVCSDVMVYKSNIDHITLRKK
jgi:hypothetical protein